MTYSVLQGRTITLPVEWLEYPGGPAAPVTDVTIEIKPVAGGAAVVGPTAAGITHVATGLDTYQWAVLAAQAVADYVAIWRGTDAQGDQVTATDIVTVAAQSPPIPGSYATLAELANAMKPKQPPANAEQMLVDASADIDDLIVSAVYATDATGMPTDPEIRDALRDATIGLVRWWLGIGEDGTGVTQVLTSASIAGVSLGFGSGGKAKPSMRYGPRVPGILARAGLMGRGPYVIG